MEQTKRRTLRPKNEPKPARTPSKLSRWGKNNEFILISFFTSLIISIVFMIVYGVAPFGDKTVMRMDMYHQYGPLLSEFYDRVTSSHGLTYSWQSGGGGNFLGNFFNYLSSPFSLLVLLFGHKHVPEAIAWIIVLKNAFAASFFTYYLKKSTQFEKHNLLTAGFGLLYAFSGYFVAYYWNFMWLDGYMMLPLIILGLERIVDEGKPWLYTLSFAYLLIASYYMAYMTAIFMVLYFLVYYIGRYPGGAMVKQPRKTEKGRANFWDQIRYSHFLRSLLRCICYAVVSAAIAAFAILPTYFALKNCSATSGTFPTEFKTYFNLFEFLGNQTDALDPTIRSSEEPVLPNIFCGIGTVVLAILFFYIKSIPLREKLADAGMLAVLYASFNINKLNYIWHGFHFPNDLPYRQSFVYVFFLLLMAFKALMHIRELKSSQVLTIGLITAFFVMMLEKLGHKNTSTDSILETFIFLALYILCFALLTNKNFRTKTVAGILFVCMFAEVTISDVSNFEASVSVNDFSGDYTEMQNVKDFIQKDNGDLEDYRMEQTQTMRIMNPSWYGYNGVNEFSSMAYEKTANLQYNLGLAGNYINSYIYMSQTPIYNAIFGIKYLVNNNTKEVKLNKTYFKEIGHTKNRTINRNNFNLPLAFSVNNSLKDWDYYNGNPLHVQEDFWSRASGVAGSLEDDTIEEITFNNIRPFSEPVEGGSYTYHKEDSDSDASFTMSFTPEESRNYYLFVRSRQVDKITVTSADNQFDEEYECGDDEEFVIDLGVLNAGVRYDITAPVTADAGSVDVALASLNEETFTNGYNALNDSGALKITSMKDTEIDGTATIGQNEFLYTSINYDDGWSVYVDGSKLDDDKIFRVGGALLGADVGAGKHDIKLVYHAKGQREGALISVAAIVILLLLAFFRKRRKNEKHDGPIDLVYVRSPEKPMNSDDRLYEEMFTVAPAPVSRSPKKAAEKPIKDTSPKPAEEPKTPETPIDEAFYKNNDTLKNDDDIR